LDEQGAAPDGNSAERNFFIDCYGVHEAVAAGDNEGDPPPAIGDDGRQLVLERAELQRVHNPLQHSQQFSRLERWQGASFVILDISGNHVLRTGLHGGHHLDRILKVAVRKVQRLFDGGLVNGCN
jgi:hypothetical protein